MLRALYDAVEGTPRRWCDYVGLGANIGLSRSDAVDAARYLFDHGLLERHGPRGAALSTSGIDEIERTSEDASAGDYFGSVVVNQYNTTINAGRDVIHQHGTGNAAAITTTNEGKSQEVAALLASVRAILQQLPSVEREEAFDLVQQIEDQATAEQPKKALVKSAVKSLREDYATHASLAADAIAVGQFLAQVLAALSA